MSADRMNMTEFADLARALGAADGEADRLMLAVEAAVELIPGCLHAGITINRNGTCHTLASAAGLPDVTPAQAAIAWVAQQPGVTTVIPGARNVAQARANAAAGAVPALPAAFLDDVRDLYDRRIREQVHGRW